MTILYILSGVGAFVLLYIVVKYNGYISLRNRATNAWKQIDVQLKYRHDVIPNLVNTVKGYMKFEQTTLEKVIQARNEAVRATGVSDTVAKENVLGQAMVNLRAVMEKYPDLKSDQHVRDLMEDLRSTENKLAFSRQLYNDEATKFNTSLQKFPGNIIANGFHFQAAELFEIQDSSERAVPKVDLGF